MHLDEQIDYLSIEDNYNGSILANDMSIVKTKFSPKEEGKYKFQIGLAYFGLSTQHYKKLNYHIAGSLNKVLKDNLPS